MYRRDGVFLITILVFFSLWAGFLAGRTTAPRPPIKTFPADSSYSLITSPQVSIQGYIQKIENDKAFIQNVNNVTGQIGLFNSIYIIDNPNKRAFTISSKETNKIQFDRNAEIGLTFINGEYKITSIKYPNPLPPKPN